MNFIKRAISSVKDSAITKAVTLLLVNGYIAIKSVVTGKATIKEATSNFVSNFSVDSAKSIAKEAIGAVIPGMAGKIAANLVVDGVCNLESASVVNVVAKETLHVATTATLGIAAIAVQPIVDMAIDNAEHVINKGCQVYQKGFMVAYQDYLKLEKTKDEYRAIQYRKFEPMVMEKEDEFGFTKLSASCAA